MKSALGEKASVTEEKITGYLMSPTHGRGRNKFVFFQRPGFSGLNWRGLADALWRHATANETVKAEDTAFGTRYTVEGPLETPSGNRPIVRSVWIVEAGTAAPRLATAYPIREKGP